MKNEKGKGKEMKGGKEEKGRKAPKVRKERDLEEFLDNDTEAVGHGHVERTKVVGKPLVHQQVIDAKVPHILGVLKRVLHKREIESP